MDTRGDLSLRFSDGVYNRWLVWGGEGNHAMLSGRFTGVIGDGQARGIIYIFRGG